MCVLHPQLFTSFLQHGISVHIAIARLAHLALLTVKGLVQLAFFWGGGGGGGRESIQFDSLPQSSFDCPKIKTSHRVQLGRKSRYAHARLEMLWLIQISVRVVPLAIRVTSAFVWGKWMQGTFR